MLRPVSRLTLGEQAAIEFMQMISEGRWKLGQKLLLNRNCAKFSTLVVLP